MTEAEEILHTLASTLYCMGQDWVKGDGSAEKVEPMADEALAALSVLVEECIGEDERMPKLPPMSGMMLDPAMSARNKLRKEIRNNLREKGLLL